jgi:ABC-type uncharacterized transport system permease subunit
MHGPGRAVRRRQAGHRSPDPLRKYTAQVILSTHAMAGTALPWLVPAGLAVVLYLTAAWPGAEPALRRWHDMALYAAWLAHGAALLSHLFGWGSPEAGARFGFAPALSATVWLVVAVYVAESRFMPMRLVRRWLALAALATLALFIFFPGEGRVHSQSPWAPLHWIFGIASYGLFGTAVLHAALMGRSERSLRASPARRMSTAADEPGTLPLLTLEKLTFRFVALGFAVLSVALLLGWWFAAPWRWDHKAVFSVMGWAVFAALLIGRRALGWRGKRATRWLYAGAALLLLAYVGSRFVLEVLLQRSPTALAIAAGAAA